MYHLRLSDLDLTPDSKKFRKYESPLRLPVKFLLETFSGSSVSKITEHPDPSLHPLQSTFRDSENEEKWCYYSKARLLYNFNVYPEMNFLKNNINYVKKKVRNFGFLTKVSEPPF